MIGGFQNITKIPELKKRIIFTLLMLVVYRLGCHIPTPGINGAALAAFFSARQGTLFGLFDMFSGGALKRMSVMALGIMPYISASIILELLAVVVPYLEKLKKEGEQGRKKITQYTRYGTVLLSMIQGFGIAIGLERMSGPGGAMVVPIGGWGFRVLTVITLTAGTAFLMWLGEQITERGIGNGISLIIFAGIVARFPVAVANTVRLIGTGELTPFFMALIVALMIAVVAFIVFIESGQRRIPVQYAKRVVGRKMYGGQSTHIPLKVNTAGVIPPIFASSIIMFPATIANFLNVKQIPWLQTVVNVLAPGHIFYVLIYVIFIVFFCYFYTAVHFNPVDVADNMKKYGGFIPGIRPGKNTAEYIDRVLTRITFTGAIYVSAVCVLPQFLIYRLNVPFYFGGTALLIVVGVAMDTSNQIESHMLTRHYEGFMKKGFAKVR
ncbi:MAG: preprotein translocase subunit SecY [Deltaproteobacteria bacterium]|nr:preprotein translocase subunit SecY [Deltaproteobacteria bacterium]MBW1921081.1 preprotein translocase subunit SecY [Deltaproteobacteria bacterium]MBW1934916.1 preprotein translocase subunit SecY [Deltaproteobacteria bacterium]MBW1978256.1 preprotein translocase subunit SecY [Deltaproteobacteria bacterium]MBW2044518.1 preprotein translocase subunit SecY [Deltaproteobacteria bacterium]